MARSLMRACLAAFFGVCFVRNNAEGAPYARLPQLLNKLTLEKNERLWMGLSSATYGSSSTLDIARDVLRSLSVNISGTCANQSAYLLDHINTTWALQMIDAIGKPSAGLLKGNVLWLGDFDECTGIGTGSDTIPFSGHYCLVSYPFQLAGRAANLQVGSCLPSGCSSEDALSIVGTVLMVLNVRNATGFTADCHLSNRPYNNGTYVAMVICSAFAAMLTMATIYDLAREKCSSRFAEKGYEVINDERNSTDATSITFSERISLVTRNTKSSTAFKESGGTFQKFILSFSFYDNGKKLLSTHQNDGALGCINGIRFLSMTWVILGHTYVVAMPIMSDPAPPEFLLLRSFQAVSNATVSVDSFFILSGLLVTYLLLIQLNKGNGLLQPKEWCLVYLHRYIRLTPVYMIVLMIWTCLANHFYDGPLWPTQKSFDTSCEKYWWTNLLYVNNFIPWANSQEMCMGWSWYMANDMQFFLITPPLAYLMYRKWFVGVGITSLLIAGSVGAAAGVSLSDSLTFDSTTAAYFDNYYVKPWCRFMTYGVGILLGYILYHRKGKDPLPKGVIFFGWVIAAVSSLAALYGPYDATYGSRAARATVGEAAANNALSRLAWAFGLSWLIFACCTNSGGWINNLLSWKVFIPLGRLTYCAYLIHPMLLLVATSASRQILTFDDITMTLRFLGMLVISLALAFVTSLSFEAPIIGLERLLLRPEAKKK